jgi:hypothetical protein
MLIINFFKSRSFYFKPKNILIIIIFALTLISYEVLAAQVSNSDAARILTNCILADDAREKVLKDGSYSCCSTTEKVCIWCPTSADKNCVVKPSKIVSEGGPSPFITVINPVFFNDLTGETSKNNSTLSPLKNFLLRKKAESNENKKNDSGSVK